MSSWGKSGRRPSVRPPGLRTPRPLGSWGAAIERAKDSWDGLRGTRDRPAGYSETAAAAILSTALGLWSDTAASMGEDTGQD